MSEENKPLGFVKLDDDDVEQVTGGGTSSMEFLDTPCPGCSRKPILKVTVSGAHFIASKYICQKCHWEAEKLPE